MKTIVKYQCEFCNFQSENKEEIYKHESSHFSLTPDEYNKWRKLCLDIESKSSNLLDHNNENTRKAYDDAIDELIAFELQYNLLDKYPSLI